MNRFPRCAVFTSSLLIALVTQLGCSKPGAEGAKRTAVDVRANVLPVYDTTAIHARAAVDWMLSEEEAARAAA